MTTLEAPVGPEPPTSKPPNLDDNSRLIKIKKLKAKLINEEHRLVLMKKIRQSQTRPVASQSTASSSNSNSTNNNNNNNILSINNNSNHKNNSIINHNNNNLGQSSINAGPGGQLKKLRPNSSGGSMVLNKHQSGSTTLSSGSSPSLNQTPAHAHQRPKVNTLWNPPPQQSRHPTPAGLAAPHVGNLSRQPITTPPNVVQAMMGSLTGPQSLLLNQINAAAAASNSRRSQQLLQQSQPQSSFNPKTQASQLLMQKKSNFKPSIQKQLEQTILQQQQQLFQQSQKQSQSGLGFTSNLNKRSSLGISSPHVGNLSRPPITTPPNVVQDLRGTLSGQQSLLMNSNNLQTAAALAAAASRRPQISVAPSNQTTSPLQSSSFNKATSAQMLLQKKSAAKSAIQKQLEQTLMQLPQKQIQSPIDFLPNANNIEYVYYIGLEACVDYLTDTKNPLDKIPLEKPYECSTCGTDFTPAWSWKKTNELVCENCVGNSVRKSIKNTQSNRIKSILTKAVKQESEVEQRIMAEATNVVSAASPTSSSSQQHSLLQPTSHHSQQTPQRGSSSQAWPRINSTPQTISSSNRSTHVQSNTPQQPSQPSPQTAPNPLAGFQPGALAAFLQTNPQFSSLASLINNNNTSNQLAQVTQLLMNQMFGNFRR